ncbi:cullin [Maudiozyma humilis]|uniref:Cullin n=1 Tax=Maudiozyma humilis TaxID=51915 RepID=A0AAV5RYL4_MAUHU|nr:cullin [Kazachstania humilis]
MNGQCVTTRLHPLSLNSDKVKSAPEIPSTFTPQTCSEILQDVEVFVKLTQYLDSVIPLDLKAFKENIGQYESRMDCTWSIKNFAGDASARATTYVICRQLIRSGLPEDVIVSEEFTDSTGTSTTTDLIITINTIWYYVLARVQQAFKDLIEQYIVMCRENNWELYSVWFGFSEFIMESAMKCSVPIQYVLENYRDLVDPDHQYDNEMEVFELLYVETTLDILGDGVKPFFKGLLKYTHDHFRPESPQGGPYFHLLTQAKSEHNLLEFFREHLSEVRSTTCIEPVGSTYWWNGLDGCGEWERYIASYIVGEDPGDAYKNLYYYLIFERSILDDIFKYYYSSVEYNLSKHPLQCNYDWFYELQRYDLSDREYIWDAIALFIEKLDFSEEIYSDMNKWIGRTIWKQLESSYKDKDGVKLIFECCKLHYFFPRDKILKSITNMARKLVDNDDQFLGFFLRVIGECISRLARSASFDESSFKTVFDGSWCREFGVETDSSALMRTLPYSYFLRRMFFELIASMGFNEMGDKALASCLTKQLLRNGVSFLNILDEEDSFVYELISRLRTSYPETHSLGDIFRSICKVNSEALSDPFVVQNSVMEFCMLFLKREEHADLFSGNDEGDDVINLPLSIKQEWDVLVKYFKDTSHNGHYKTVRPAYNLQRCEVRCPFVINGSPPGSYVFDLTLYQACVLDQFNSVDKMTFSDLLSATNIEKHTLQSVLKSFVAAGLMIKNGSSVQLNNQYEPDFSKVVGHKIYIPLGKISPRRAPLDNSNPTSRSSSNITNHTEGHSHQWKRELLKAAIVRILKGATESFDHRKLYQAILDQIAGVSVGEFADALQILLRSKDIVKVQDEYMYYLD